MSPTPPRRCARIVVGLPRPAAGSADRWPALPALGCWPPSLPHLLFDTAVVGRLGALSLAGLAVGGLVVAMVSTQLTFLSYGTTARSARFHGAHDRHAAVREGVQATWLAIGLGLLMVVVASRRAAAVSAIAGDGAITDAALPWLRIAIIAAPAILISLAGQQLDARRPGHRAAAALRARRVRVVGRTVPAAGLRLAGIAALGPGRLGGGQCRGAVAGGGVVLPGVAHRACRAAAGFAGSCACRW